MILVSGLPFWATL